MSPVEVDDLRRKRKEEGKLKKRRRIDEAGGVRPRAEHTSRTTEDAAASPSLEKSTPKAIAPTTTRRSKNVEFFEKRTLLNNNRPKSPSSQHRFGRVMTSVPCRNKPRFSTVSIAVPGSVLSNCQTRELRTLMVGQIARAATIYHVDEIVVFDDQLGRKSHSRPGWKKHRDQKTAKGKDEEKLDEKDVGENKMENDEDEHEHERRPRSTPEEFMARLLQYCECPQYLRRHFFPMHPDLQFAGILAPVDAPHHVRAEDHSGYREGVVLPKQSKDGMSLVNCGIRNRPVE